MISPVPGDALTFGVEPDGMRIDYQVPVPMSDGAILRATRSTGGMTHADPDSRPEAVFGGHVTLPIGPEHPSYQLLPVIPPNEL